MEDDRYPVAFDEATGRAFVQVSGEICVRKIHRTFAAIALDKRWPTGDRSVLWHTKAAFFPTTFEFADIFETTQVARALIRPGRSAVVVARKADMLQKVARFYQSIATTSTPRHIELFFSTGEATAWLDGRSPETGGRPDPASD